MIDKQKWLPNVFCATKVMGMTVSLSLFHLNSLCCLIPSSLAEWQFFRPIINATFVKIRTCVVIKMQDGGQLIDLRQCGRQFACLISDYIIFMRGACDLSDYIRKS